MAGKIVGMQITLISLRANRQYCVDVKIIGMQIILNFTNSKLTILCGCENSWNADYTEFHRYCDSKLTILCGCENNWNADYTKFH